ncbi:MAG TPA: hypothetical protein VGA78_11480 [Gemmatimonadales bacterium]
MIAGALLATISGWHRTAGDILLVIAALGLARVSLGAWYAAWRGRSRQ